MIIKGFERKLRKEFALSDAGRVLTQIRAEVNRKANCPVTRENSKNRILIGFKTRGRLQSSFQLNRTDISNLLNKFVADAVSQPS